MLILFPCFSRFFVFIIVFVAVEGNSQEGTVTEAAEAQVDAEREVDDDNPDRGDPRYDAFLAVLMELFESGVESVTLHDLLAKLNNLSADVLASNDAKALKRRR